MAVSGATSAASPTSGGTNIDVNGIVGKLMAVEQKPLTALSAKEASYQSKISAFGQVKGALSAFQTSLRGLYSANKFLANAASSSNPSVLTATATSAAPLGSHSIVVNSLAQGPRLATAGLPDSKTPLGSGTLTFDFGSVTNDGKFIPNVGKLKTTTINDAEIVNNTVPASAGSTILATDQTTFTPDANSEGKIPARTLTINGVEVDTIDLLDSDSPIHRAQNLAEAFDEAYVKSGGESGTFTAKDGKVTIKAESGGSHIIFGIAGKAKDADTALKNLATIAKQTGLSPSQLGTQAYVNSNVLVGSTVGLSVGDPISGGGFPDGTTITKIIDTTHFQTSLPAPAAKNIVLNTSSHSSSRTVVIDSNNNSLEGIRDAINANKIGVTASIVNDGSDTPNRLVLNSEEVGSDTNIRINVNGDATLTRLLSHDPTNSPTSGPKLAEIRTAKDTSLSVDGINIVKKSNTINDAIPGVTLKLLGTGVSPVTMEVSRDTAEVRASIEGFVKSYNDLKKITTDLTAYNAATKKGAALQGDSAMRSLESQIDTILSTPLGTTAGSLTTLSQIGISKQTDGTLAIDSNKLNNAIGTKFNEIASLFAAVGTATDNLVNFKSTTALTKPGNYDVAISELATQGSTQGNKNLNWDSVSIEPGTKITVSVDGTTASVALVPGSYVGVDLAKMLQESINDDPTLSAQGKTVLASINSNGFLNITSNAFGSKSAVRLGSESDGKLTREQKNQRRESEKLEVGTPVSEFMGSAVSKSGKDVSGTIDGVVATGTGQLLTSNKGNSSGLQVQVSGGALGNRGSINYTQGYAHKLNEFVNSALGGSGLLTGRLDGLNSSVKGISKERDAINARLTSVEDRYRRQYTKLDATLDNMHATSNYLSQQLAKL